MTRLISPRLLLALGVVAALGGAIVHAQRTSSSAAMATAAEKFLGSLTPEQRQQATFQFDSAERLHAIVIASKFGGPMGIGYLTVLR